MSRVWRHLILFDGMCGLCSRTVQFVLIRDRAGLFAFAPLQSEMVQRFAIATGSETLGTFIVVEHFGTAHERVLMRSAAALFVGRTLGWPWSMSAALSFLPAALLDRMYDVVASNRYRMFGRRAQCFMPRPEDRDRFIDSSAQ
jgi:predicted DCC family thiol-disulfide oxidoreductase YuxK